MPIRPADSAALAKEVRELYVDAENILLGKIAAALAKGVDRPAWADNKLSKIRTLRLEVEKVLAELEKHVPREVARALEYAYQRGIAAAAGELATTALGNGAFKEIEFNYATTAMLNAILANQPAQAFQIMRSTVDLYQEVITKASAQVTLGTVTRREAARRSMQQLAARGITTFIDQSGRRWDMGSYNEMAVRTASSNAMLQGTIDRMGEFGSDLVIVSDAPEECKICRPFEGKVLSVDGRSVGEKLKDGARVMTSLSAAKSAGLFHNNCRHSLGLYIPGHTKRHTDTADPKGNALREQQRAYERRVRELKRRHAIDKEFGGPAAAGSLAKLRAKQQEFTDWREANGRKDLAYRTSLIGR